MVPKKWPLFAETRTDSVSVPICFTLSREGLSDSAHEATGEHTDPRLSGNNDRARHLCRKRHTLFMSLSAVQ